MNAAAQPDRRRAVSVLVVATMWALVATPFLTGCPTARLTHHPCPGCGMTRAVLLFLHGDFHGSFTLHPLALPTLASQLLFLVATFVTAWRVGVPYAAFESKWGLRALYLVIGIVLLDFALWIVRGTGAWGGPVPV